MNDLTETSDIPDVGAVAAPPAPTGPSSPARKAQSAITTLTEHAFDVAMTEASNGLKSALRTSLPPLLASGALAAVANSLHEQGASPTLAATGAGIALGALVLKRVRTFLREPWKWAWAGGSLALAAACTAKAIQYGVDFESLLPTAWILSTGAAGAPWWWLTRNIRPGRADADKAGPAGQDADAAEAAAQEQAPLGAAEPMLELEAAPVLHEHQKAWETLGTLRDSTLLDPAEIFDLSGVQNGMSWTIDGGAKRWPIKDILAADDAVKGLFDRDFVDSLVFMEPSPRGRKTQARLIILDRNPFMQDIVWREPVLDMSTGLLPLSLYPDGSGWANYVWFKPGWGAVHDLVAGTTGSGKSGVSRHLARESMGAGIPTLLFDPHKGASLGRKATAKMTKAFLTERDIYLGFRGVEAMIEAQMEKLAEVGEEEFGPAFGYMPVHIIVEEATLPLVNAYINAIVKRLAQEGRKIYFKLTVVLQVPSVDNLGEAGLAIREQLAGGNTIMLRCSQGLTGRMAYQGDLPVSPWSLPSYFDLEQQKPTTGLGYVLSGSPRALQSRVRNVPGSAFDDLVTPQLPRYLEEAFRSGWEAAELEEDDLLDEEGGGRRKNRKLALVPAPAASSESSQDDEAEQAQLMRGRERALEYMRRNDGRGTRTGFIDSTTLSPSQFHRVMNSLMRDKVVRRVTAGEYELVLEGAEASGSEGG